MPASTMNLPLQFIRTGSSVLTAADFLRAAAHLDCDVFAVQAVTGVEAPRGGFDERGRPTILFERHLFRKYTGGRWDSTNPGVSNATPGGYGNYAEQYDRLAEAYGLNPQAALRATSWGAFQILGDNHIAAGCSTVEGFVSAVSALAASQLDRFVVFICGNPGLLKAIRARDWAGFARLYNGPAYAKNAYDTKLAKAYAAAKNNSK